MIFSCIGAQPSWELTDAKIAEWQALYPSLDVEQECMKALAWTRENNRKTAKGMPRFLVRWLNRAADRRGGGERRDVPRSTPERRQPWSCPHLEQCSHRQMCEYKLILGPERYPVRQRA